MPYILQKDRVEIDAGRLPDNAGELNYKIFKYIKSRLTPHYFGILRKSDINFVTILWIVENFLGYNPNYQRYNDMVGALTCCYNEVKRRYKVEVPYLLSLIEYYQPFINIYEDKKIQENGDIE